MKKLAVIFALILSLIFHWGLAAGGSIIVNLRVPASPWIDSKLSDKLDYYLSSISNVPVVKYDNSDSLWMNTTGSSFQELLGWCRNLNGRFLVDISVNRIDVEKRKTTVFPEIVFRYRNYAIIEGTLRILDVNKERMVKLKKLNFELKATDRWQVVDDNENDPALSIPSDKKIIVFERLEDRAAKELFEEIRNLAKGNYFGK
jgi:hypothetical protein